MQFADTGSLILPGWQPHSPGEASLWQFEPVDHGIEQRGWVSPLSGNQKLVLIDDRLHLTRIDAWQSDQDENFPVGLEHVHRRLPRWTLGMPRMEEMPMQSFRAFEGRKRLRPHPDIPFPRRHCAENLGPRRSLDRTKRPIDRLVRIFGNLCCSIGFLLDRAASVGDCVA